MDTGKFIVDAAENSLQFMEGRPRLPERKPPVFNWRGVGAMGRIQLPTPRIKDNEGNVNIVARSWRQRSLEGSSSYFVQVRSGSAHDVNTVEHAWRPHRSHHVRGINALFAERLDARDSASEYLDPRL